MQAERSIAGNERLCREYKTIASMAAIYCKDIHGCREGLCPKCQELLDYAGQRLGRCPYGEGKPACVKCPTHCYRAIQREEVRSIMRYAGPLMLWHHPLLALRHFLDRRHSVTPVTASAKAQPGH